MIRGRLFFRKLNDYGVFLGGVFGRPFDQSLQFVRKEKKGTISGVFIFKYITISMRLFHVLMQHTERTLTAYVHEMFLARSFFTFLNHGNEWAGTFCSSKDNEEDITPFVIIKKQVQGILVIINALFHDITGKPPLRHL